ncbi:MAG: DUF3293 domain-containing protein [Zoogloeaceae bacterium]|jgi:hypothetical protein|nr:DUF3293 domain-containing protein [Zoogloeaceae bacterium]
MTTKSRRRGRALEPVLLRAAPSPVPPALRRAYRDTAYHVTLRGGAARHVAAFVLRVGRAAPEVALAFPRRRCWALLTAWNPQSARRALNDNRRAQSRLRAALRQGGWRFFTGENRADPIFDPGTGAGRRVWPPEASLFVPGLPLAAAVALARRFRQKAILADCRSCRTARAMFLAGAWNFAPVI